MTARIDEIAPDLYRISVYVKDFDLQFNHFLIKDDEPLLFHTGMRGMFPLVRDAVAKVIDPAQLRWIGWSHFEMDECGALNEWLAAAPQATPVCGAARRDDQHRRFRRPAAEGPRCRARCSRPAVTGSASSRRRICRTGGTPACCSTRPIACCCAPTCCTRLGDVEPVTSVDITDRYRHALASYQQSPVLMDYVPYNDNTRRQLAKLAALKPRTLAAMHGSTFVGDGAAILLASADVLQSVSAATAPIG